jgi:hypothetical protein
MNEGHFYSGRGVVVAAVTIDPVEDAAIYAAYGFAKALMADRPAVAREGAAIALNVA